MRSTRRTPESREFLEPSTRSHSGLRPRLSILEGRSPAAFLTLASAVFYSAMAAAGCLWLWWTDRWRLLGPDPDSLLGRWGCARDVAGAVGTGLLCALGIVVLTQSLLPRLPGAGFLERQFQGALHGLMPAQALFLALWSGVGEELLFRGLLQTFLADQLGPWPGLVLASTVFGLVHTGRDLRYWIWTAFALATGFLLGLLFLTSGSLLPPIAMHVGVNGMNLLAEAWRQR